LPKLENLEVRCRSIEDLSDMELEDIAENGIDLSNIPIVL
jgi:hypothetical protein